LRALTALILSHLLDRRGACWRPPRHRQH
jgi:hypothetical protein